MHRPVSYKIIKGDFTFHILVTDDSIFQRKIVTSILKKKGYLVLEASNGKDALEILVSKKPDLMILDLLMPEMDGFEVLREAKKTGIEVPIVVLTSDIQESTREMCESLGAMGFVNKPVDEEILLENVSRILER
ncbi:response regulator [Methanochimaera problematica]|nr:response regulator [Methanoplanus sp. FWC-SCC4]